MPLLELAAREVAASIPFELVENYQVQNEPVPVPEELQRRIAFWSFPEQEEDIRLYSCLANGSADEFVKGKYHNTRPVGFYILIICFNRHFKVEIF